MADPKTVITTLSPALARQLRDYVREQIRKTPQVAQNGLLGRVPIKQSQWLKITSAKTRRGVYGAKMGILKPTFVLQTATDTELDPADVFDYAPDEDCLYYNQPEIFAHDTSHFVPVDGNAFTIATLSDWPNDLSLPAYEGNYAKSVKDVDFDEDTGCYRKTFVTQPQSDDDWDNIVCLDDCDTP